MRYSLRNLEDVVETAVALRIVLLKRTQVALVRSNFNTVMNNIGRISA